MSVNLLRCFDLARKTPSKNHLTFLGAALLSMVLFQGCSAAPIPEISCPPPGAPSGSTLFWVATRSVINGLPMAILALQSEEPKKQLVAWYLKHWRGTDTHPDDIVYPSIPWTVVARKANTCFETIQIRSTPNGSLGYIGISLPSQLQPTGRAEMKFPVPPCGQLLLSMSSDDAGKQASNFLIESSDSVQSVVAYYRRTLTHLGWAQQMNQDAMGLGRALMFQRQAEHAELAVSSSKGMTHVFVTIVHD
jgi:hypothetical protein